MASETSAITWLVRLRSGEATLADAHSFQQWRTQGSEHEQAVRELAALWSVLGDETLYASPAVVAMRHRERDFSCCRLLPSGPSRFCHRWACRAARPVIKRD
ncbi:FecR/PupR family sigma factor regulator [Paraburkholderia jirisanensis]